MVSSNLEDNGTNISPLTSTGFKQSISDPCLFYKIFRNEITCIIGLYVDDMIICGANYELINTISKIKSRFKISNCQPIHYLLGIIKVEFDNFIYSISQKHVIENLIDQYRLNNCRLRSTPCTGDNDADNKNPFDVTIYKSIIGSLIYIARCTRPDISFAVHRAARNCEQPTVSDYNKVINIVKYLKSTINFKISYDGCNVIIRLSMLVHWLVTLATTNTSWVRLTPQPVLIKLIILIFIINFCIIISV